AGLLAGGPQFAREQVPVPVEYDVELFVGTGRPVHPAGPPCRCSPPTAGGMALRRPKCPPPGPRSPNRIAVLPWRFAMLADWEADRRRRSTDCIVPGAPPR